MWKSVVALSLAGLITSLGLLFDANLRYGAPRPDPHAQIQDVLPGSPAAQVGLKSGDIILAVDGVDVSMGELKQHIACGCSASQVRQLLVERDGQRFTQAVRTQHRRIGIHFGQATRYEPNPIRAARNAFVAWQSQAFAPVEVAAALSTPCPFGERHVVTIHSAPHRRAAITSVVLFWGSLFGLVAAFGVAIRRRRAS